MKFLRKTFGYILLYLFTLVYCIIFVTFEFLFQICKFVVCVFGSILTPFQMMNALERYRVFVNEFNKNESVANTDWNIGVTHYYNYTNDNKRFACGTSIKLFEDKKCAYTTNIKETTCKHCKSIITNL